MARRILVLLALVGVPCWTVATLSAGVHAVDWPSVVADAQLTAAEALVLTHVLILMVWMTLMGRLAVEWRHRSPRGGPGAGDAKTTQRAAAWLSAGVLVAPTGTAAVPVAHTEASLPVGTVVSPLVAASVLAHILRRRREQISSAGTGVIPDRLTESETSTMNSLRRLSIECDVRSRTDVTEPVQSAEADSHLSIAQRNPGVAGLLDAVERATIESVPACASAGDGWQVVVKVFGYPTVTNAQGHVATFRKSRSLELLTWLALNRDRQRRSAARTALWDIDVSDGTFSTVASEMRRALTDLCPNSSPNEWCPATYSDAMPLKSTVVTDAQLLQDSLRRFRQGSVDATELVDLLRWVRDVPFAGTGYSWADLDGTTTRLVILAVEASTFAARWAREHDRHDVLTGAVAAGLRVMPGCVELLELQEDVVRSRSIRVAARPRR